MGGACCSGGVKARVAPEQTRTTVSYYAHEWFGPLTPPEAEICTLIQLHRKAFKNNAISSPGRGGRRGSLRNADELWIREQASGKPSSDTVEKLAAALGRNRLFALASPASREEAAGCMLAVNLSPEKQLCKQGEHGANLFVVESGELTLIKNGETVGRVGLWDSIGELEIICDLQRHASVNVSQAAKVWVLSKPWVDTLRSEMQESLRQFLTNKSSLCRGQSKQMMSKVQCLGVLLVATKGQQVMCAGDSALSVGIVVQGTVQEQKKKFNTYHEGQHFGMEDTLNEGARKITITVSSETAVLYMIDKVTFDEMNNKSPNLTPLAEECLENLRTFPELQLVQAKILTKLALNFKTQEFAADALVVDGQVPDYVGIVTQGKLIMEGKEKKELIQGDTFNQAALQKITRTDTPEGDGTVDWTTVTIKAGEGGAHVATLSLADAAKTLGGGDSSEQEMLGTQLDPTMCGRQLSDLEDIGLLGNGAYGSVRMVSDKRTKTIYALKSYNREKIVKMQVQQHVENEKLMMLSCNHPFVLRLIGTFEDTANWHMVLELVQGGDLFGRLDRVEKLDNHCARFYMVGTMLALDHLHQRNIVYRDLKPENLLIDSHGYIKLADFGLAKRVPAGTKTFTVCGTPEYMSPELIGRKGHNKAVDYWSIGILIFEMLSGMPPFYDDNPMITYTKIFGGKITWPKIINPTAKDLIKRLLEEDPTKRLGCLSGCCEDVKRHSWLAGFDYDQCLRYDMKAPWVPSLKNNRDLSCFDP